MGNKPSSIEFWRHYTLLRTYNGHALDLLPSSKNRVKRNPQQIFVSAHHAPLDLLKQHSCKMKPLLYLYKKERPDCMVISCVRYFKFRTPAGPVFLVEIGTSSMGGRRIYGTPASISTRVVHLGSKLVVYICPMGGHCLCCYGRGEARLFQNNH